MNQPVEQPNQTVNDESVVEFVPLLHFEDDYEILNQHPFTIRKKSNHHILSESLVNGYPRVSLKQKSFKKHILIGKQFIKNDDPEHKTELDHIDHDRANYHLSNLRWVSRSTNHQNKTAYKGIQAIYVDDIPDDAMMIDYYDLKNGERREFESHKYYYYFDESNNEDIFYAKITDNIYRILHHNILKGGYEYVLIRDINNKIVNLMINRFKRLHDLL